MCYRVKQAISRRSREDYPVRLYRTSPQKSVGSRRLKALVPALALAAVVLLTLLIVAPAQAHGKVYGEYRHGGWQGYRYERHYHHPDYPYYYRHSYPVYRDYRRPPGPYYRGAYPIYRPRAGVRIIISWPF